MSLLFRVIRRVEEWVLAYGILVIAMVTIGNVLSRVLRNESLAFAEEVSQFFIILVTFLGLSYAAGHGRHIRMSALYDQLPPRGRKVLMIVIAGVTAAILLVMAFHAGRYVTGVYSLGTVSPVLRVPLWLVYAAAPLGFVLAGVQYLLTVARNLLEDDVYLSWEHRDEYEELPVP
jgi:C4-dicarboxylate transporter, DctQ subunit